MEVLWGAGDAAGDLVQRVVYFYSRIRGGGDLWHAEGREGMEPLVSQNEAKKRA